MAAAFLAACSPARPVQPPAAHIGGTGGPTIAVPGEPSPAPTGFAPATLIFRIKDATGRLRSDVPIQIVDESGKHPRALFSGADGTARLVIAPGIYRVKIPLGCAPQVQVLRAEHGTVGVVQGRTTRLTLHVIEMRRRYYAEGPMRWSIEPPWIPSHGVDLSFALWDRCRSAIAPRASFASLAFVASAGLRVKTLASPVSDQSGLAHVTVTCVRQGDATLRVGDPIDAKDRVDLLALRKRLDERAPWCDAVR